VQMHKTDMVPNTEPVKTLLGRARSVIDCRGAKQLGRNAMLQRKSAQQPTV
jgi:hypothetical protein